jgi:hypothetical protein
VEQRQDGQVACDILRPCVLRRISRSAVKAGRATHGEGWHQRATAGLDELGRDVLEAE